MTELTVNINKSIHAPIEKVFNAWLDPEMLAQFILPMPGMPNPEVENDAREGGNFSIIMSVGSDKILHTGTYLTIKRPTELTFSWQSPFSTDASQVTLLLSAIGADTTQIELTHIKFIDEESRANHEGGWRNILEELEKICVAD